MGEYDIERIEGKTIEELASINVDLVRALHSAYDNLSWHPDDDRERLLGFIKDVQGQIIEALCKADPTKVTDEEIMAFEVEELI